jgi:protein phosphatase PTC6
MVGLIADLYSYQEDTSSAFGLQLPPQELEASYRERLKTQWDGSQAGSEFFASQVGFFGIFDG